MKVVIILEILLSVWFLNRNPLLSQWLLFHWSMWFLFHYGNVTVFQETLDTYPDRERIEPRWLRFIWKPLIMGSDERIPREMYYADLFVCVVFGCYTLALLLLWASEMILPISKYCFILSGFVLIISRLLIVYKAHLARYKRISSRNLRYLFDPMDESLPQEIGWCEIIGVNRKGKNYVVSVLVNDALFEGVIIEKTAYRRNNERYNALRASRSILC